ncbi:MAG: serpin family protein [Anaerolineales bacterium]|nr:serpin family protein [Anaerolineales bacterium]
MKTSSVFSLVFALTLLAAWLAGCSSSQLATATDASAAPISGSDQPATMETGNAEIDQLVRDNTSFAFDLYRQLFKPQSNLAFSPYSLSSSLALAYAGARHQTASQMAAALHFNLPADQLHAAFDMLEQELTNRDQADLSSANALWAPSGRNYQVQFLETLAAHYGAGLQRVDFGHAEDSRLFINQWISEQTDNHIQGLLPAGSIGAETELMLTNAVYFQAAWAQPFAEDLTAVGTFTRLDGSEVSTPMMHQVAELGYASLDGLEAIELPYEGHEWSLLILLPEPGRLADLVETLNPDMLATILATVESTPVDLGLPRSNLSAPYQLKAALMALGMRDAFGCADFSGIDGSLELFIDEIYHQADIALDEAGTQAAAASAIVMARKDTPAAQITVSVDRPFIFLIRDTRSGTILFLGQVVDPSE